MLHHLELLHWIKFFGYFGIFLIIFIETGVFIGFLLPGDSLLFAVGLLSSQGHFSIEYIIPGMMLMAFLGYLLGYWFGERLGGWLLKRPDSFWFKKIYIFRAKDFYLKHGMQALILGRLIPVVRTFVPIVAGMAQMPYGRYVIFNLLGAIIWTVGVTLLGYYFGHIIPHLDKYIFPAVLLVILLSLVPVVYSKLKKRFKR